MSRKLDWADAEARKIAKAVRVPDEILKTAIAYIASTLRVAHSDGIGEGLKQARDIVREKPDGSD